MSVTWLAVGQCADPPYLTLDWIGSKSPTGRFFFGAWTCAESICLPTDIPSKERVEPTTDAPHPALPTVDQAAGLTEIR